MPCSCGTNGDGARSALQLKRSYISSVANTGLTNSYKRYGQGHCDQAYLHLNDCYHVQISNLLRGTPKVGVYKSLPKTVI